MLDLVITGGKVVSNGKSGLYDIGIKGEKIVSVDPTGTLADDSALTTIDACGKLVIPGGVEAHTHVGFAHLSSVWGNVTAGPEDLSKAALWGGTTTMMDFAKVDQDKNWNALQAVRDHVKNFNGRMYIDYSAHVSYLGPSTTPENIGQVKDLVAAGFPSIKVYTTNHAPMPNRPVTMINTGQLVAIMEQAAKHGAILAIHSEDDEIVQWNYQMAQLTESTEWWRLPQIRSNISEDLSVRKCVRIAELTGAAMYIVHTSSKEGVEAIAESRAKGYPVDGETILLYCSFNSENYKEYDGMKYHTYPSTKSEDDRLRLWEGLHKGDLNILATDAIGTSYKQKTSGRTAFDVQGGNNGIEIRIPVAYTEGVVKQGMSVERFVDIVATNPAKLLGMYPQKGCIAPGSDADIVILDTSVSKKITYSNLHLNDYTPWEGWEVKCWPSTVTLRGKIMIEDNQFLAEPSDGKLVKRRIAPSVLSRPL